MSIYDIKINTDINNPEIKTLIENINKDLDIETIDENILKILSYTDKNFIKQILINFKNNIIFEDIEEISDYWTIKNKITNTKYEVFKYAYRVGLHKLVNNEYIEGNGLRQGFQQPICFIEEQNELNVLLYPNPNQGEFSFVVNESNESKLDYQLYDQQGKLIFNGQTDSNLLTPITIQQPTPGMYHLRVSDGTKIASFKINVIF